MAHQTDHKEWLVVGSSPSADEYARLCRARYPMAATIATNSGGRLFPQGPDYYYVNALVFGDDKVDNKYLADCKRYKAQGTRLITIKRNTKAQVRRGTDWFDEFITMDGPGATWQFKIGHYSDWSMSGLMIVQYALNMGAERVHLVGHEGYRSSEGNPQFDHFDGFPGPANGHHCTHNLIKPAMQAMVDACPWVEFYFYGAMNYEVKGDNVNFIGNHEQLAKDEKSQVWLRSGRNAK